jgi:putative multiple sugar transport system substrate-binding protein
MRATSRGRRRLGVGLSLSLAVILVMTVVAPVGAVTVGAAWRAKIGGAGSNGTATIQAYTSRSGSLVLKLARLKAATYLPVTLSKGTCASVGSRLITFPYIRTTSAGTAARTSGLTVAQVAKIKAATKGTGRMAIRVGSRTTGGVRCGVFTLLYVPIGIVLPSNWVPGEQARFQDALKATGYGAQILLSQDSTTERTDVEALISRGMKVLILTPQGGAAAATAADEAKAAGVSVISNDRLILNTVAVDYYVTFDNVAVGAAQAQYLIDRAGATKGNNLYLYAGAASDNNSFAFLEGAWEKLQPRIADGTFVIRNSSLAVALQGKPTLTRDEESWIIGQVTTNWDFNTARNLAKANLFVVSAAEKSTVFILAPNDNTARAIAGAFAADKDVITSYVTGQDAEKASVQYIIDGKQGMTVFKDPRSLVKDAIAAAVAFLKGGAPVKTTTQNNGTIDVPSRLLPAVAVTRDNIQAALIDSGYYLASDFTGSWPGKP